MTAVAILEKAKQRGIILQAEGDRLRIRAPKGTLTPELREAIAQHKQEILTVLQSRQPATGHGLCPGPEKCGGCYSIGVIDGKERFLHPPKISPKWKTWFKEWEPKEGSPIQ